MRTPLHLFILMIIIGALISCSSSSTGTDPDPNTPEEPAEPEVTTGTLEVEVATAGEGNDEDGYTISLDEDHSQSVETNGTVTFADLEEGNYTAELSGLGEGCTVNGDNPVTADVTAGQTTTKKFEVTCETVAPKVEGVIAFTKVIDQNFEIFIMNADGSGQQRLTNNALHDDDAAISPDGTKIAFMRQNETATNYGIWVMNVDGSGKTQLTSYDSNDRFPTWSPDGTKIAFESDRDGDFNIYVMDADGANPVQITSNTAHDQRPDWAPEGDKIMFTSSRDEDGASDIYVIQTDGSGLSKLLDATAGNGNNLFDPVWSPDATQVAYQGFSSTGGPRLFIADADGSNATMLEPVGYSSAYHPTWSPDGGYLAFTDLATGSTYSTIWIVKPDGTDAFRLTDPQNTSSTFPSWGIIPQ